MPGMDTTMFAAASVFLMAVFFSLYIMRRRTRLGKTHPEVLRRDCDRQCRPRLERREHQSSVTGRGLAPRTPGW